MKRLFTISLILCTALLIASCAGIRYVDEDPLPFQDIDYGFDVQYTESDPSIAYIDEGSGDKTLLLVHGLASNAGFWRYNIDAFARDYRVIVVDLPGYGKSDKGDYPYGMNFYAKELVNLIEELSLEDVVYLGHSMGGQIGITLALNYPDEIEQLILAAPAGIEKFDDGEGEWLVNAFSIESIVNATEPQIRANLSINFYRWSSEWEWMVEERVRMAKDEMEMREFAYTVVNSIEAMIDEPTTDFLPDLTVPTTIIYGKYDGLIPNRYLNPGFPSAVFQKGDRLIPDSSLIEINNVGHMLMIEKPDEFNRAVLQTVNE